MKALEHYGAWCRCCGEREPLFLTFHHANEDGAADRRVNGGGDQWFRAMLKVEPRDDLRVLCFNCHYGSHANGGICPHERVTTSGDTPGHPSTYPPDHLNSSWNRLSSRPLEQE